MRINLSGIALDEDYKNILVKISSGNYPGVERLRCPEDTVQVMNDVFRMQEQAEEYLYLVCMTAVGKPISFFEAAHGTCTQAPADIRGLMVRSLLCGAVGILIVHNHPGGNPSPSVEDIDLTKRLQEACILIGMGFYDHIIIGRDGYYSFRKDGKL